MSDATPDTDPAGDAAQRAARGRRSREILRDNPEAARFARTADGWRETGNDGAQGADPFAPLGDKPADKSGGDAKAPEVWEPQFPAPGEPPEAGQIRHSKYGPAVQRWVYRSAAGEPAFVVARFEFSKPDGSTGKETYPYTFGRRQWTTPGGKRMELTGWHFKRPKPPTPLYGLDRLAADPDALVVVCEGEKAADAVAARIPGAVGITSQGGSKAGGKGDWSALGGRSVLIWPDHDTPGAIYSRQVTHELAEAGAARVCLPSIPEVWPDGWDLADDLPEGVDAATIGRMVEEAVEVKPEAEAGGGQDGDGEPLSPAETQAEIERLSKLPPLQYAQARKASAAMLGVTIPALDDAVKAEKSRRKRERDQAERQKAPPGPGEVRWPPEFSMTRDGLQIGDADGLPLWLSDPFVVLGEGRDIGGEGWALLLAWKDPDNRVHRWLMPKRLLHDRSGELEKQLADRGLRIATDGRSVAYLRQALGGVQAGNRVMVADRVGWHAPAAGADAYVMADGSVVGKAAEALVLRTQAETGAQMAAKRGTLDGWKRDVATLTAGNTLAAFALSCAFVGPLMDVLGEASGGFHLFGRSKTGKTAAVAVAASVWGLPKAGGAMRSWRSTANSMEVAAEDSNDGFLVLDELHQADPREVVAAAYMLANEAGKGRLKRDATAARSRRWRNAYLSTGELDLTAMAAKAQQVLPAGAEVRLPSLPVAENGNWPELHGHATPAKLMATLYASILRQHGTAAPTFLERLATERQAEGEADLIRAFEAMKDIFIKRLPEGADPQVADVARRFALAALAGELAASWGVLPWEAGEAQRAAEAMMSRWLARRGTGGATEELQHVRAIRLFLLQHGASRFVPLRQEHGNWVEVAPDRTVLNRAGWRREIADGRDEYLIPRDVWREVCAAANIEPQETARTLKKAGLLHTVDKALTTLQRVPGVGTDRFITIKPEILGTDRDPAAQTMGEAA